MASFVLVGGAWMGAWVWHAVTGRLRALGHEVYPATLTGLGDRVHLARPDVDLDTHILDVTNLMAYADLSDVFLVGHSYAGSVVTGVADRAAERLAALIYCDSGPLRDGQCMLDLNSPRGQAELRQTVNEQGDGWRLPFPGVDGLAPASVRGLGAAERALMERKATAQPFATWTTPLRLTRSGPPSYRRIMLLCDDGKRLMAMARENPSLLPAFPSGPAWEFHELDTGHWPMLSQPAELAALLATLAAARPTRP
jgi:pimeloyl-ACP methyl ester carboxylesterase